jgi:hypothetical protein
MGLWERAELVVNWAELKWFWALEFLEESLEKGNTRKHTKNRVTRWGKMFGGIWGGLRWFTKRILEGELGFTLFRGFRRWSTWVHWGGGTLLCFLCFWVNLRDARLCFVGVYGGRAIWSQEQPLRDELFGLKNNRLGTSYLISRTTA